MLIRMNTEATAEQIGAMRKHLRSLGYETRRVSIFEEPVYSALPEDDAQPLKADDIEGCAALIPASPTALVSRAARPQGTRVRVGDVEIGGDEFVVVAGPCSVESLDQLLETALSVRAAGAHLLRGGAYKPRTSTYSFQGLAKKGLLLLAEVRERTGLGIITEVIGPEDVSLVDEYADMLQVGARNMQNFPLLKKLGKIGKPVLLKRGAGNTLDEWLSAAEYIVARGNDQVVLCERGIRTFETYTRNTLDISAVAAIHELSHLPIMVDPSHATGRRSLIESGARAALASGADGMCVEVHVRPNESVSDRDQALSPNAFDGIMKGLRPIARAVGRTMNHQPAWGISATRPAAAPVTA